MYRTRDKLLSETNKPPECLNIKIISTYYLKLRKIFSVPASFHSMLCSDNEAIEGCTPPIDLFPSDRIFHLVVVPEKSGESARIVDPIQQL